MKFVMKLIETKLMSIILAENFQNAESFKLYGLEKTSSCYNVQFKKSMNIFDIIFSSCKMETIEKC